MPKIKTHINALNIRLSDYLNAGLDVLSSDRGLNRTEYVRFLIQREMEIRINK